MCIIIVFGLILLGISIMSFGLWWSLLIGIGLIALAAAVAYFSCVHRFYMEEKEHRSELTFRDNYEERK